MTYWSDKIVLVTGGYGFLGRHLVSSLEKQHPKKIIQFHSKDYDLRISKDVHQLFKDHNCNIDIIIHLAASVGGINANRKNPAQFFYDNMMMGMLLMDAAYQYNVKKFVCLGTICEYPLHCPVPFQEKDIWNGYPEVTNAPYGIAKKSLLVMGQAYRQQYNFNVIHICPTNLYGPYDNFDLDTSHVIPAMIRKMIDYKDQTIVLYGDGSPTRDFLYVDDAVHGILLATEYYNDPEPLNLGSGQEITMKSLASQIANLTQFKDEIIWDTRYPNGQPRRLIDVQRAKELIGFQAKTSLVHGLKNTIHYYVNRN